MPKSPQHLALSSSSGGATAAENQNQWHPPVIQHIWHSCESHGPFSSKFGSFHSYVDFPGGEAKKNKQKSAEFSGRPMLCPARSSTFSWDLVRSIDSHGSFHCLWIYCVPVDTYNINVYLLVYFKVYLYFVDTELYRSTPITCILPSVPGIPITGSPTVPRAPCPSWWPQRAFAGWVQSTCARGGAWKGVA